METWAKATVLAAPVLGAAVALSGCNAGHTATTGVHAAASEGTGTLRVATGAPPASLDFTTTGGAAIPQALMGNVYETLVRIDASGNVTPGLAKTWDISPDRRTYTFHLREGVRFSNGSPFNASTAEFSIHRVKSPAWSNGQKKAMDPVQATRVIDEHTLEVTLDEPSQSWLWNMGTLVGAMMTPDGVDKLAEQPVGTGPYLVDRWAVGTSLSFTENPDYWGPAPRHSRAELRYFHDQTAATNALRTGDVDVVWAMSAPELIDAATARGDVGVEVGTSNGELLLSMNNQRAPFNDVAVRRAVFLAVDRQGINQAVFEGHGTDTGGTPVAPADPWFDPRAGIAPNPEQARRILEEAGYATDGSDPRLAVTLTIPSLNYAQDTAEILFSQLREVGFQPTIESAEFPSVWLSQVMGAHDYQMSLIAHVEPRDITRLFGDPTYYLGFDSPAVREAFAAADSAPEDQSEQLMRRAVSLIMEEAGALTIVNVPNVVLHTPGVTGIEANVVTDSIPLPRIAVEQGASRG